MVERMRMRNNGILNKDRNILYQITAFLNILIFDFVLKMRIYIN